MSKKRNKMQGDLSVLPATYVLHESSEVDSAMTIRNATFKEHVAKERTRNFTAKPCPACVADRPADSNFSRVFATRGKVRYCRCGYCGHTWKDSDS